MQEAILLTMKDKHLSSSLIQNASTDHYSEREFGQAVAAHDKHKRMSEISRGVKHDATPPQALRPMVTERLSSGLGLTSKSAVVQQQPNRHHSKSP